MPRTYLRSCLVTGAALLLLNSVAPNRAKASTIISFTSGIAPGVSLFGGQAVTTPSGGPWDALSFSWFSDVPATTHSAAGHLFLLSQTYSGTPSALSSSTAGFIAESQLASGGAYVFSPSVTIQPNTLYYFFMDATAATTISGSNTGATPEEFFLKAASGTADFANSSPDTANFILSGTVVGPTSVPEPMSLMLGFLGIVAIGIRSRFSRT